jgi:D-alanyl-D-alanine dipeptidase
LLDVDVDQAIKDLTVDMDSVIDDLSFRSSTHAGEVSEAYKKTDPKGSGLMSIIPEN